MSWQTPPELFAPPGQREIEMTNSARLMLAITLISTLLFAGVGLWQFRTIKKQHQRYDLLSSTGITETAHVKRWWSERQGKATVYAVSYDFTAEGKTFEGKSYVSYRNYTGRSVGEVLPVRYLPGRPEMSGLLIENPPLPYWMGSIYLFMPLIFLGTISVPLRRQWNLFANGTATAGVATQVARTRNGLVVRYEFKDSGGSAVKGKAIIATKSGVTEGSPVTVLYLIEDPEKNGLYPSALLQIRS